MNCLVQVFDKGSLHPIRTAGMFDLTPECGFDSCDTCGDCLSCYGEDPCISDDEHSWVYEAESDDEARKFIADRGGKA